jgi:PD-(D/E)XK nuclease superfamily
MITLAAADLAAPVTHAVGASELARRIYIPRRLPVRHDGQPLRHVSHSSYSRFLLCPEDWRRHYLLGQRAPPSAAMFLGGRVDDALTTYHRQQLEHGQSLTLDQLHDAYRDHWTRELAAEASNRGIAWDAELDEPRAFTLGLNALTLTLAELVPALGRPTAVQRQLEYALAPGLEWTIHAYLDLETCARTRPAASRSPRSSTTRSRAPCTRRPGPTTTRRPACTSPAAGCRAIRRTSSASRRSASPAPGASR